MLVRWEGAIRDASGETDVVVGTTDRCVVYCSDGGRFGLLPREHVSAVESETARIVEYDLQDYRLVVVVGAILAASGFLGGVLAASGLLSLVLLLAASGGLWLAEHGWRHREAYDGVGRRVADVERVVLHADGGARTEFLFPADARAGADLSRFVRSG